MEAYTAPRTPVQEEPAGHKRPSPWRLFFRNWMGTIGLLMLTAMCAVAILAPSIAPYDPYEAVKATTSDFLAPPSPQHILGQDDAGRDVLSSVIYGARISLLVGFSAALISVSIGSVLGMISGYFGGRIDMTIMRITDSILVIPRLPLMLVIIAIAGRGIVNIILVIGLLTWTYMARVVRSQVLTVKERVFVLRARAIGAGHYLIMVRHILPQVVPVIFAEATLDISYAILTESTLSFLGLGDPTLVSWGSMLNRAYLRGAVTIGAWWFLVPPGLALAWVTLGLTFLSNGIQQIVNPRLKTHHLFDERAMVTIKRILRQPSPADDKPPA